MITVRSLGECVIHVGSTVVTPEAQVVFATTLYFAHHGGRPVSRRALAALFWPEADDQHAAHCVRQALYRLRALGVSFENGPTGLVLSPDAITLDHTELAQLDHAGIAERVRVGTLEFLPTYAPAFSAPFATWVDDRRQIVHAAVRRRLSKAIAHLRSAGRVGETEPFARACLALDPLNEEATLALAEALAVDGGRSEALGVLERYTSEIGRAAAKPASEIAALRRRIAETSTSRRSSDPHRVPLIGRETELETVAAFTAPGATPAKRGCYISGDPGIGKSRLVFDAAELATIRGFHVEAVRCQSLDAHRPLSLLFELVPRLRMLPGALGCDPALAEYLQRLADTDLASKRPGEGDEPGAVRLGIQRAVVDLVDAVATESPLLLVVDDAHCLDPHSWRMLAAMLAHAPKGRVVVYLASRAAPAEVEGEDARAVVEALERLTLAPLSDGASLALLEATAEERETRLRAEVGKRCVRVGAGNPFYLLQLLDHALDGRPATTLPQQLKALLDDRLTRIGSEALGVLQTIGILQSNATIERLDRVLQHPTHYLLAALTELESNGLIVTDGALARCRHDLLAEAAVGRLASASRMLLESRVATVLETELESDRTATVLWDCAEHWRRAGAPSRALAVARSCGVHALMLGLPNDAATIFRNALAFCGGPPDRLDLLALLRDAQRLSADWHAVYATSQERMTLGVELHGPEFRHGDDEHISIQAAFRVHSPPAGIVSEIVACLKTSTATTTHRLKSAAYGLILVDNCLADSDAHTIFSAAADLTPTTPEELIEWDGLSVIYHSCFGDLETAVAAARDLDRRARAQLDREELMRRLRWSSLPLKRAGLFEDARMVLEETYARARAACVLPEVLSCAHELIALGIDSGDVAFARRWLNEAVPLITGVADSAARSNYILASVRVALLERNTDLAARALRDMPPDHLHLRRVTAALMGSLVELHRQAGSLAEHISLVNQLEECFHFARTRCEVDFDAAALTRAMLVLGRDADARDLWCRYRREWRRELFAIPWFMADLDTLLQQ
jgi:DNA-binding SARP family transcriptional activator